MLWQLMGRNRQAFEIIGITMRFDFGFISHLHVVFTAKKRSFAMIYQSLRATI